jgi:TrmH family RNA methyltransferase
MVKIKNISSTENADFKLLKSLTESKGLKKEKLFLVSGKKLVSEFINRNSDQVVSIIFKAINNLNNHIADNVENNQLLSSLEKNQYSDFTNYQLTSELFNQIDILGTHYPILVAKQKLILKWNPDDNFKGLEILCPLSDPQNLGSVARSAWALGADRIILLKEAAHPFLPKTWKASAGMIWDIPLYSGPSVTALKTNLIALDMDGEPLWNFKWPTNSRLLLGEEGQGIPSGLNPIKISIPMQKGVESLNVSVAGSLAINHYYLNKKK